MEDIGLSILWLKDDLPLIQAFDLMCLDDCWRLNLKPFGFESTWTKHVIANNFQLIRNGISQKFDPENLSFYRNLVEFFRKLRFSSCGNWFVLAWSYLAFLGALMPPAALWLGTWNRIFQSEMHRLILQSRKICAFLSWCVFRFLIWKKNTIVHTFVGQNIYNESEVFIHPFIHFHFIGFIHFHWQVTGVHGMPGPDGHLFMRQGSDVCRALWLLRVPRRLHVQQNGLFESRFVKKRNGTSPNLGGSNPNSNSNSTLFLFLKVWPTKRWALEKPFEISESEKGFWLDNCEHKCSC